jgi:hypothetical protein
MVTTPIRSKRHYDVFLKVLGDRKRSFVYPRVFDINSLFYDQMWHLSEYTQFNYLNS